MANKNQFTAEQFIKAIKGSGGIISVISNRIGCDWHTAKRYITDYATIKQAYDNECESVIDLSESLVITNIQFARAKQEAIKKKLEAQQIGAENLEQVDSGDAKWWLTKKGKGRGFGEKIDIDLRNFDISKLSTEQLDRIAKGEDVYNVIATPGGG